MKILHLVQFYEAAYAGGVQRYVGELARSQKRTGLDVSVLTVTLPRHDRNGAGGTEDRWHHDDGAVPVIARKSWGVFLRTPIYPSIVADVGRSDADVLHVHGPSPWFDAALLLARPSRGSLVLTLHNTFPRTTRVQRRLGWIARRLMHRTMDRADAVIAPHDAFLSDLVPGRVASRIADKLYLLPPGVDRQRFRPLGLARDERCVLFVAHIRPEKGLHVLVEAMTMLPHLRLEVLCTVSYDGAYFEQVRRQAVRRLGSRVSFTLDPDSDALVRAYNSAACVVVPSTGIESWSLVLLEAAACGAACVRTDLPGLAWADFAPSAPAGNAAELARVIQSAIDNREELGTRAKKVASGYSWERTCRETLGVYRRVAAGA